MSNTWLLATMGIVLSTASAFADDRPPARPRSDAVHGSITQGAAAQDGAVQDAAVLDVVLQDLLARPRLVELPEGAAKQILFSTELDSEKVRVEASEVLKEFPQYILAIVEGEKLLFAKLSQEQSKLVREAAEELARRLTAKEGIKPFVPKDKQMRPYSKKEEKEHGPKNPRDLGPQVFHALPPGYSHDRRLAIVFIEFGWSDNIHPALGRYVLIKKQGRWTVLRASIYFFV